MRTGATCCSSSDFCVYRGVGDGASPHPYTIKSDFSFPLRSREQNGTDAAQQLDLRSKSHRVLPQNTADVAFRGQTEKAPF